MHILYVIISIIDHKRERERERMSFGIDDDDGTDGGTVNDAAMHGSMRGGGGGETNYSESLNPSEGEVHALASHVEDVGKRIRAWRGKGRGGAPSAESESEVTRANAEVCMRAKEVLGRLKKEVNTASETTRAECSFDAVCRLVVVLMLAEDCHSAPATLEMCSWADVCADALGVLEARITRGGDDVCGVHTTIDNMREDQQLRHLVRLMELARGVSCLDFVHGAIGKQNFLSRVWSAFFTVVDRVLSSCNNGDNDDNADIATNARDCANPRSDAGAHVNERELAGTTTTRLGKEAVTHDLLWQAFDALVNYAGELYAALSSGNLRTDQEMVKLYCPRLSFVQNQLLNMLKSDRPLSTSSHVSSSVFRIVPEEDFVSNLIEKLVPVYDQLGRDTHSPANSENVGTSRQPGADDSVQGVQGVGGNNNNNSSRTVDLEAIASTPLSTILRRILLLYIDKLQLVQDSIRRKSSLTHVMECICGGDAPEESRRQIADNDGERTSTSRFCNLMLLTDLLEKPDDFLESTEMKLAMAGRLDWFATQSSAWIASTVFEDGGKFAKDRTCDLISSALSAMADAKDDGGDAWAIGERWLLRALSSSDPVFHQIVQQVWGSLLVQSDIHILISHVEQIVTMARAGIPGHHDANVVLKRRALFESLCFSLNLESTHPDVRIGNEVAEFIINWINDKRPSIRCVAVSEGHREDVNTLASLCERLSSYVVSTSATTNIVAHMAEHVVPELNRAMRNTARRIVDSEGTPSAFLDDSAIVLLRCARRVMAVVGENDTRVRRVIFTATKSFMSDTRWREPLVDISTLPRWHRLADWVMLCFSIFPEHSLEFFDAILEPNNALHVLSLMDASLPSIVARILPALMNTDECEMGRRKKVLSKMFVEKALKKMLNAKSGPLQHASLSAFVEFARKTQPRSVEPESDLHSMVPGENAIAKTRQDFARTIEESLSRVVDKDAVPHIIRQIREYDELEAATAAAEDDMVVLDETLVDEYLDLRDAAYDGRDAGAVKHENPAPEKLIGKKRQHSASKQAGVDTNSETAGTSEEVVPREMQAAIDKLFSSLGSEKEKENMQKAVLRHIEGLKDGKKGKRKIWEK